MAKKNNKKAPKKDSTKGKKNTNVKASANKKDSKSAKNNKKDKGKKNGGGKGQTGKNTLKPVSVGGIEFSALISEDRSFESIVPEYSVEKGYNVTDAIILGQEKLALVLFLTDTPVTWAKKHPVGGTYVRDTITKLEELYYSRKPVKVITTDKTYENMVIEQISISKSLENGYGREIPISFRKIKTTKASKTKIPAAYGKSGVTQDKTGTTGTTTTSTGSSTGSGSNSSTSRTSSSGSSGSSGRSSGSNKTIMKGMIDTITGKGG